MTNQLREVVTDSSQHQSEVVLNLAFKLKHQRIDFHFLLLFLRVHKLRVLPSKEQEVIREDVIAFWVKQINDWLLSVLLSLIEKWIGTEMMYIMEYYEDLLLQEHLDFRES